MKRFLAPVLLAILAAACGPIATAGPGCGSLGTSLPLPDALKESSGVAVSLTQADVYWTHTDAASSIFAINGQGEILQEYALGQRLYDLEDIAVSTCPGGGPCLYLADLGDNYEERTEIQILRAPEPTVTSVAPPGPLALTSFPVKLPDGPRDIEALMVLPGERIYVATKGRNHPVTVYRYPGALRPDTVELEEVQALTARARIFPRQVTGGAAAPRGGIVALRTYESLQFYRLDADTLVPMDSGLVNLRPLQEPQGEAVSIGLDGHVVLTSEGGPGGGPGSITRIRCTLER